MNKAPGLPVRADKAPVSCETGVLVRAEKQHAPSTEPRRYALWAWSFAIALHIALFSPWGINASTPPVPHAAEPMTVRLYTPPPPAVPPPTLPQAAPEASPAPEPIAEQPTPSPVHKRRPAPRKTAPVPERERSSTSNAKSAARQTESAPKPSAGEMLEGALSDMNKQGWAQASERFATDSAPTVQNALERYRLDWVRNAQRYADLHFPRTAFEGQLLLAVTVTRDGQLSQLDVIHSTGNAALDAQALKTIRAAAPYRSFDSAMGNRRSVSFQQRWVFNRGALFELQ